MSSRAAKRQKRIASPSESGSYGVTIDGDSESHHEEGEEDDDEEEDIRPGGRPRRTATGAKPATETKKQRQQPPQPATPTKQTKQTKPLAAAAVTGRRQQQLASRQKQQKRPERGGLRQSALSFSKAVPLATSSPDKGALSSTQESAKENHANGELEDDLIQDDDGNEAGDARHGGSSKYNGRPAFATSTTTTNRQASFTAASQGSEPSSVRPRAGSGKQTPFGAPSRGHTLPQKKAPAVHDATADLPWAQRYAPRSLDELGVHKRKVADVRAWLDNVLKGYEKKRLLVLRGPSGAGKTATVQTLARELGFNILEWKNPLVNSSATGGYSSNTASLEDFLSRGQRYGSLSFESGFLPDAPSEESQPADNARRIILMEELPHVFSSNSTSSRTFRESILRYLLAEESFFGARDVQRARPPIVLIISESSSSSATAPSDSLTAHRVLGPEILQHPRVTPIEFNPVATTILAKALEQVLQRATQDGAAATQVSPAILHKLAERGDLRAGIAALEFMCLARSSATDAAPRPVATKRSRAKAGGKKKDAVLTMSEAALVDAVAQRSTMLDLFHAVGKVMYNKRTPSAGDASVLVSEVDVDALLDDSGTEPAVFIAALHENYALSCAGDSFIDVVNASTDVLSATDLLMGSGTFFGSGSSGTDAAAIRQADLAAHVAVQGLLHGLPHPVKRSNGAGRDAFKMFWPESLRVRGRADEVIDAAQRFVVFGSGGGRRAVADNDNEALVPCARSAKEALLDDVPYGALIAAARGASVQIFAPLARLENSRWGGEMEGGSDDDARSPKKRREMWKARKPPKGTTKREIDEDDEAMMGSFIKGVDEKWVLSDDDIED